MNKEAVLETVKDLPSATNVKAWIFEANGEFYHVAAYSIFRAGDQTSIWKSNKKGKRMSEEPIFHSKGKNHVECIKKFLDTL